jgi:SAM-dependent methyltransferase
MASLDLLQPFHDRRAGASDAVFGRADVGGGRASYDHLVDRVPTDAIRVLDLACGDGPVLARLGGRGVHALVGLDANAAELGKAAERLGSGAELVQGLAQELPFDDASFDAVTSHMALMLMDDSPRVIAEVRRVLRPGGKLVFVVGRHEPPSPREVPIWRWLRARWQEEGLKMRLGDGAWADEAAIRAILGGFADVELAPLDAVQIVRIEDLGGFLENGYYPVDALSEDGKRELRAFIAENAGTLAPDGTIPWTFEMRVGSATHPSAA